MSIPQRPQKGTFPTKSTAEREAAANVSWPNRDLIKKSPLANGVCGRRTHFQGTPEQKRVFLLRKGEVEWQLLFPRTPYSKIPLIHQSGCGSHQSSLPIARPLLLLSLEDVVASQSFDPGALNNHMAVLLQDS